MASNSKKLIYVGGSMRQRGKLLAVSKLLRDAGYEVFNDWAMPGEETDVKWQEFEQAQGHTYFQALCSPHAKDVFEFDKEWLDRADALVMVCPAGRSAHLELGYTVGRGKPAFVFMDSEPERWDVMLLFATAVCNTERKLLDWLEEVL
jgi:nucleoside 2-deoxyribosyltransferase